MKRELYPADWTAIATKIKTFAGWKCEACRKQCYRPGDEVLTKRDVLTVAHLDHDPGNCAPANLKALCSQCHIKYDGRTRRIKKAENWRATILGIPVGQKQLDFFLRRDGNSG